MEQMKKVLVIGCKGMAGHVIKTYLESLNNYQVNGIARNVNSNENLFNLDVFDTNKLEQILKESSFDIVINCIGLLNKTAEDNPELAIWFNSYFPHLLSKFGNIYGFKLIHISTDCVFSGKEGGYKEDSFKNGNGFYAQSKALGEVINNKDLTFRTSIIGPELKHDGIGLFHWFMNQENEISGFSKAYWTGVTTLELAKGINHSIQQDLKGLYHFVNESKISKYDLINIFNQNFRDNKIKITEDSTYKIDKSLISTRNDFKYNVSSYTDMIFKMKQWMLIYNENYKHYNY
jgi:dTDP-4-dehydrorhamnose reductase